MSWKGGVKYLGKSGRRSVIIVLKRDKSLHGDTQLYGAGCQVPVEIVLNVKGERNLNPRSFRMSNEG